MLKCLLWGGEVSCRCTMFFVSSVVFFGLRTICHFCPVQGNMVEFNTYSLFKNTVELCLMCSIFVFTERTWRLMLLKTNPHTWKPRYLSLNHSFSSNNFVSKPCSTGLFSNKIFQLNANFILSQMCLPKTDFRTQQLQRPNSHFF